MSTTYMYGSRIEYEQQENPAPLGNFTVVTDLEVEIDMFESAMNFTAPVVEGLESE
jgi:hypothetical protein